MIRYKSLEMKSDPILNLDTMICLFDPDCILWKENKIYMIKHFQLDGLLQLISFTLLLGSIKHIH